LGASGAPGLCGKMQFAQSGEQVVGWGFYSPAAVSAFLAVPALSRRESPPAARAALALAKLTSLGLSFYHVDKGPYVVGVPVGPPLNGRCAMGVAAYAALVALAHETARAAARRLGLDTRVALHCEVEGEVDEVADCSDPLLYFSCEREDGAGSVQLG
jgi:hypothetical protein